jgi:hypothetical protein
MTWRIEVRSDQYGVLLTSYHDLNGTVQEVYAQARALYPAFDWQLEDRTILDETADLAGLQKRQNTDGSGLGSYLRCCNIFSSARCGAVNESISCLRAIKNHAPGASFAPGRCGGVSCSYDAATL